MLATPLVAVGVLVIRTWDAPPAAVSIGQLSAVVLLALLVAREERARVRKEVTIADLVKRPPDAVAPVDDENPPVPADLPAARDEDPVQTVYGRVIGARDAPRALLVPARTPVIESRKQRLQRVPSPGRAS